MANTALFEETFTVDKMDPDGKKFDKVSRIEASVEQSVIKMQLDVNTEIYRIGVNDKFTMMLAPTLSTDGTPDTGYFTQGGRKTLADRYEYVMHGKLYKIADGVPGTVDIYASFGGLLMKLGIPSTPTEMAKKFDLDQRLFLLMRKV